MTCTEYGDGLVMCRPPQGIIRRHYRHCPTCDTRRRFVQRFGGAWYGSTITCVACGDSWGEEGRMERPFKRGWRQEATADARRDWAAAMTPRAYRAAVLADLEEAIA